jgi:predicted Abi (CAAX) family protease
MFVMQHAKRLTHRQRSLWWQRQIAIACDKLPMACAVLRFVTLSLWFIVLFSWAWQLAELTDDYSGPPTVVVLYALSLGVAILRYHP